MAWVVMRRNRGPKDEITYSFFNGIFSNVASNMFERLDICAYVYDDYDRAKDDCSLLAKQGLDVSVETKILEKEK